ncbi:MAG: TSUP family transporter [Rhodothermales bacterium]
MDVLDTIEGLEWLYLCLVLLGASFVHGSLGMGFPMIFTALAAVLVDVKAAVFIIIIPSMLINIRCLTQGYDIYNLLKRFSLLAVIAGLGSAIGTQILLIAPQGPIKIVLVASIAFYLLLDRIRTKRFDWIQTYPFLATLTFGFVAGTIGGITNAMGPLLIIYFLENQFGTDETVQGLNLCFLVGKIVQLVMFMNTGSTINLEGWIWLAGISILVFGALIGGIRIRQKMDVTTYRHILKVALGIIALVLFFQILLNS